MDSKEIGKKLLECIDSDKLVKIVIEDVALAALKNIVDDSANKFDDAAYALVAPLLGPQIEKILGDLLNKLKA